MTSTQPKPTAKTARPAGPGGPSVPEPRVSTETRTRKAPAPERPRRRIGRIITAVLAAALLVAVTVGVTIWATSPDHATPSPGPSSYASGSSSSPTSVYMPDYRGYTIISAANGLRASLGQNLSVTAPGGDASQYLTVASQSPSPGTIITASTPVQFWPSYSSSYSSPSTGSPTATALPPGQFTSGTYEVGTAPGEIAPGKYVAAAGSSRCYFARLRNLEGGVGSIIDNQGEYSGGQVIMSVQRSDKAVEISGDCTFAKK